MVEIDRVVEVEVPLALMSAEAVVEEVEAVVAVEVVVLVAAEDDSAEEGAEVAVAPMVKVGERTNSFRDYFTHKLLKR